MIRSKSILLVEDNPGDVNLARIALRKAALPNTLNVVKDGDEALDYLYNRGNYHQSERPDLILLDLNLPRKDGREVLEVIKRDQHLRSIPVVVLSSSRAEDDIKRSYELHANSHIVKPYSLKKYIEIMKAIECYWLEIVELPPQ